MRALNDDECVRVCFSLPFVIVNDDDVLEIARLAVSLSMISVYESRGMCEALLLKPEGDLFHLICASLALDSRF